LFVVFPAEVDARQTNGVVPTTCVAISISKANNTELLANRTSTSRRKKRKQRASSLPGDDSALSRQASNGASSTIVTRHHPPVTNGIAPKNDKQLKVSHGNFLGGQEAATLRRIKSEWKSAVKMGIAYDWVKMKTVAKETDDKYSYVRIGPYGSNLLRWHFSVMGSPNSEYDGGIYHGRVLLPKDYPGSPPRVQLLTPSGRFIPGHDICLSASNYHPESWTPKWTILSLIDALRLHMLTQANEIGGMTATPAERRRLAKISRSWAAGKLSHQMMISQGVFPWEDSSNFPPSASSTTVKRINEEELDIGVHLAALRATDPAQRAERLRSDGSLAVQMTRAAVEVFKSPPRLAILILLTLFLVLNIN
jgi:ubiquitin-protein ligase